MIVLGTCTPAGGPTMFRYLGGTRLTDRYHFRDDPAFRDMNDGTYGVFLDGAFLFYKDCARGGSISGSDAEIFVR